MRIGVLVAVGFFAATFILQTSLEARTLSVPAEYKDVEMALREAGYGDTVLISPGRYKVQAPLGSGIVITSTDGPDSTILWNKRWHILELLDCDMATVVSGLTFDGMGCNICLACTTGAPVIEGNVIKDSWDGINMFKCNATIRKNVITGCNRGLHLDNSDPEVIENELRHNSDAISLISSAPLIARCTLDHNGRAFLILGHSYPTIGGSLSTANDILTNGYSIYNAGLRIEGTQLTDQREVAVATHNYWGSECPDEGSFRGEVVYRPWTDAGHDSLFERCPEKETAEEGESR
jgi:hypothetical protein